MGANFCIALNKDALLRKRGFHLNEEEIREVGNEEGCTIGYV